MAKKSYKDIAMSRTLDRIFPKQESRIDKALGNIMEKSAMSPDEAWELEQKKAAFYKRMFPAASMKEIMELVKSE